MWVPAVVPPVVAPGTARLRVTLSAAHSSEHITTFLDALAAVPSSPSATGPGDTGAGDADPGTSPTH